MRAIKQHYKILERHFKETNRLGDWNRIKSRKEEPTLKEMIRTVSLSEDLGITVEKALRYRYLSKSIVN